MSTALDPLLASCPHCPEWEPIVWSEEQKQVIEEKHNTRLHGGEVTSEAVADLMYVDPKHKSAMEAIDDLVRADAALHGGHVDPNRIRPKVPAWVPPQCVGSYYNVNLRRGVLVPAPATVSTDKRGRNAGKRQNTYVLRGVAR